LCGFISGSNGRRRPNANKAQVAVWGFYHKGIWTCSEQRHVYKKYMYICNPITSTTGGTELVLIMVGNDRESDSVPHEGAVATHPLHVSL